MMLGQYRIYPSWFSEQSDVLAGVTKPMHELAYGSAARMGREVRDIKIVRMGENDLGKYIDFDVTYSSSEGGMYGYRPSSSDR
jgi:hypothetical protein